METIVRKVRDLDQSERSALERVVGHVLRETQQIIIQVTGATTEPADVPTTPGAGLPPWCRVYDGLSDAEIDKLDQSIIRNDSSRDVA